MRFNRRQILATLGAIAIVPQVRTGFAQASGRLQRETSLKLVTSFVADAKIARAKSLPIVVLFSLPGCPHCEVIRRSHLRPLSNEVPLRATVRQIDIDSGREMIDFQGAITTHRAFASSQRIKLTPVVAFFDPGGAARAEPLVGALLADFYGAYLENALTMATQQLGGQKTS
jgi:thiol-disulfide isomerase/thioredoxin